MSTDTREALAALLPCPFCGNARGIAVGNEAPTDNSGGYFIACPACHASTGLRFACGEDPVPLLIEQWNRRAALATQPAQPSAQGEAVVWKRVPVEPTPEMLKASWADAKPSFLHADHEWHIARAYSAMLASVPAAPAQADEAQMKAPQDGMQFWLWKNGDHFLAFTHLYPCFTPGGDPMVLGEPAGRAVFRRSHDRSDRGNATAPAQAVPCPNCRGEGTVRAMTQEHGPDDYEFDMVCPMCSGGQEAPAAQPSAQGEAVADKRFYSALAAMTRVLESNVRDGIKNYVIQTGRNDWNKTRASAPAAPAQAVPSALPVADDEAEFTGADFDKRTDVIGLARQLLASPTAQPVAVPAGLREAVDKLGNLRAFLLGWQMSESCKRNGMEKQVGEWIDGIKDLYRLYDASPQPSDLYLRLHSLSKSLEGSGRIDEHVNPDAYAAVLDAMNFVRANGIAPKATKEKTDE